MDDTANDMIDAGGFSDWLGGTRRALDGTAPADVPCGGCTACCTSSQFVHIGPDETDARAHIPPELLFPAPRLPQGHVLMGYDERGRCPMLGDGGCTIYAHRPRTCRTYDCRAFPASGVELDDGTGGADAGKAAIGGRARRWRFTHPTDRDRADHDAVRAAARYVRDHRADLPDGTVPVTATQHAVLAVEIHAAFLDDPEPGPEAVRVTIAAGRRRRGRV
jgi:uncharacterized protein